MYSPHPTISTLIAILILIVLLPSCKKGDDTVSPTSVDWEGHAPNFNEAYRDTIIALATDGLRLLHKDGSGSRVVRENSPPIVFASWSPRKWKIYFAQGFEVAGEGNNLYVMNADGTDPHLVTATREYYQLAVMSPDGQKIAYVAIDTTDLYMNKGKVKVMNPDGTGVRELTPRIVGIDGLTWLPDSREVIYSGQERGYGGISVVSIDGTGGHALYTDSLATCDWPSLSPDGSLLAFTTAAGGKILLLNMQTSKRTTLTHGASVDGYATWSPDGTQLMYDNSGQICRIDASGQNQVSITSSQTYYWKPCWYK